MTEKKLNVKKINRSRKFKYGSSSLLIIFLAILIFIALNLAMIFVFVEVDMTKEGLYSIGEQTEEVIDNLDKKVYIYGMFDTTTLGSSDQYSESYDNYHKIVDLLRKYDSFENVEVDYIDPSVDLAFVNQLDPEGVLGISSRNFVVVCGNYKKVIKYYDLFDSYASETQTFTAIDIGSKAEMTFTSAINYVSREDRTEIYFTTGHNEYDYYNSGYISLGQALELNGFSLNLINLYNDEIPEDADIIISGNPESDFYSEEIDKLTAFMDEGKSYYLLMDSFETNDRFENIQEFLFNYNLALGYNTIVEYDTAHYIEGNQQYIFPELTNNLINEEIKDDYKILLAPNARSVFEIRKTNFNLDITPLLITSEKAKLEGMYDDIEDVSGATYLAIAVENTTTNAKIILSGTASFIHDSSYVQYEQYEPDASRLMLNNVNWLEGENGQIFIEQKDYFINNLSITTKDANTIGAIMTYVIPAIILIAGLIIYLKRRHL